MKFDKRGRPIDAEARYFAMNNDTPMLDWLKEYLRTTPKQQIQKDWNDIKKTNKCKSPTITEYFNQFHEKNV